MHRNVEHVIGGVHGLLVEVITNPGPVREKLLDADLITDQRKIIPEYVTGWRTQGKSILLDQADHDESGEALDPALDRELGVDVVGDLVPSICQPNRGRPWLPPAPIHPDHTGKSRRHGELGHPAYEVGHDQTTNPSR
jgi:hypothetical protein